MNLAPVVLFVYKRPDHTARTLTALAANPEAPESDLIVYADGAKGTADRDVVEATRERVPEPFVSNSCRCTTSP
jgi:hypothetical protein